MKLSSAYEPKEHEAKIYQLWLESRLFEADPASQKPRFSISMPPPNETGTLHLGHAIGTTLQDIMARHARQIGKDVLWLPGTDHAALAVNNLMEKQLAEQGTNKHEVGREEFLKRTRAFVGNSRERMNSQLMAMGASCDWGRARYTLDDALNRCVNEVFVKMFHDGLIYRGSRIVNWDPQLATTVSDDEVEHREEKTSLYTLQYGPFQIATARPETKFGDKYVVVHPNDERYKQYKDGERFTAEWINGPVTATIIKDEAIDPDFGTGAMTITPWHDVTDFEIAERHGLEKEQIIGFDGRLLPVAGEFAGLPIEQARLKIVEKLETKNLLVAADENYVHNIALNSRGKAIIEPQIMLQWFIDVNRPAVDWKGQKRSFKEVMRAVIDDGDIKIVPTRFEKVYYHWIDNLRDWCISRQIWWGHQIPVWYRGDEQYTGLTPPAEQGWHQDPDTLDTWFSSALWTWSTLVDQNLAKDLNLSLEELLKRSQDYQTYHPTTVLETGWDILFFWVARMILATTYATGQIPFKTVYLHGMVLSEKGKKMSKSDPAGSIDPLEVIPEFGADALRLSLIAGTAPGANLRLGKGKIAANRNFCNKLWNIARYAQANTEGLASKPAPKSIADHWILSKLSITAKEIAKDLDDLRFSEAYDRLYHFVWDDLADWYIEASKTEANTGILAHVLKETLLLAHPFAPFVTEAIWQNLEWEQGSVLAGMQPAKPLEFDKSAARDFDDLMNIVSALRRTSKALGPKKRILIYQKSDLINSNKDLIKRLGGLEQVIAPPEPSGLRLPLPKFEVFISVEKDEGHKYAQRLDKERQQAEKSITTLKNRLSNKNYVQNAPDGLIAESQKNLSEELSKFELIKEELRMVTDWLSR